MIQKLFILLIMTHLFLSCGGAAMSPEVFSQLQANNELALVSFIKEKPQFTYYGEPLKPSEVEKTQKVDYSDLKDLDDTPKKQAHQPKPKKKKAKKTYFSTYDAVQDLEINKYLMKSFIVLFRKKTKDYNVKHNLEVSKIKVPFSKGAKNPNFPKKQVDRDFSSVKEKLNNDLVFEIRVLELFFSKEITDEETGFLNTIGTVIVIKGFLFNLKTNEKVWESEKIKAWYDSEYRSISSFGEDGGEPLKKFYKITCDGAARILVNQFLGE